MNSEPLTHFLGHSYSGRSNQRPGAIYDDDVNPLQVLQHSQVEDIAQELKNCLKSVNPGIIALLSCQNHLYPSILLGITRAGSAFYSYDPRKPPEELWEVRRIVNFNLVLIAAEFAKSHVPDPQEIVDFKEITLGKVSFFLYNLVNKSGDDFKPFSLTYVIQTSGTTSAEDKFVFVPHQSITCNILDLKQKYELNGEDVVLVCAPMSFDPHIVEIFTGLESGATLLFLSLPIKLNPDKLFNAILKHKVTMIQCTTSFFLRLGEENLRKLFSIQSNIRLIAFGGEKCPEKEFLRSLLDKGKEIKLLNLYGTTEVSCWASIEQIDLDSDEPTSLGTPLSNTDVTLQDLEASSETSPSEIIIKSSSRLCEVRWERNGIVQKHVFDKTGQRTGDLGYKNQNGRIIYIGRNDNFLKRNGIKLSLSHLEESALSSKMLSFAKCVEYEDKIYLAVKLKEISANDGKIGSQKSSFLSYLNSVLKMEYFPDRIVFLQELPITPNGKLDLKEIKRRFVAVAEQSRFIIQQRDIRQCLENLWRETTRFSGEIQSSSEYIQIGGNSLSAARLVESIFMHLGYFGSETHRDHEKGLLGKILGGNFGEVEEYIKSNIVAEGRGVELQDLSPFANEIDENRVGIKRKALESHENTAKKKPKHEEMTQEIKWPPEIRKEWSFDLNLCVDAAPVLTTSPIKGRIALIGSHSGWIIAIQIDTLEIYPHKSQSILWKIKLSDRVEAPLLAPAGLDVVYVGCHNGKLYCIKLDTGVIKWSFNPGIESQLNGPIRSTPAISPDLNFIYFTNGDNHLYCVNSQSGKCLWSRNFKGLSTYSPSISSDVLFLTIWRGQIACLKGGNDDGELIWTFTCSDDKELIITSPVPCETSKESKILLFGTNLGNLKAISQKDGSLIWSYKAASGPIKQPIHRKPYNEIPEMIIFTTEEGLLAMVNPESGSLIKTEHFCDTPCKLNGILTSSFTNSGSILIIGDTQSRLHCYNIKSNENITLIPSECDENEPNFSSPASSGQFLAVGGRDNKLHLILMEPKENSKPI